MLVGYRVTVLYANKMRHDTVMLNRKLLKSQKVIELGVSVEPQRYVEPQSCVEPQHCVEPQSYVGIACGCEPPGIQGLWRLATTLARVSVLFS